MFTEYEHMNSVKFLIDLVENHIQPLDIQKEKNIFINNSFFLKFVPFILNNISTSTSYI
jgi:hypothetical protein